MRIPDRPWSRSLCLGGLAWPALSGAALAVPSETLLTRVVDGQGQRLELLHRAEADRAWLMLGPRYARAEPGELGLDPLRILSLPLAPASSGAWCAPGGRGVLPAAQVPGMSAQIAVRSRDGRLSLSNVQLLDAPDALPRTGQSGQVVITEFMKDPAAVPDARGEWIELTSTVPYRLDLDGWVLRDDGSNFHRIEQRSGPLWILPGGRLVLGNHADPRENGGVRVDYTYSNFVLANSADAIHLLDRTGALVDSVVYDRGTWPSRPGRSISYRLPLPDALLNDRPESWCSSTSPMPGGDRGTPGRANDPCP